MILDHKDNAQLAEKVAAILVEIKESYSQYIDQIYTAEEIASAEPLAGDFSFVIEGTEGTLFMQEISTPEIVISKDSKDYYAYGATHGHHPDKGDKPPFVAFGPSITPGVFLEKGGIIDFCPTLAGLLDVNMPQMKGQAFPFLK